MKTVIKICGIKDSVSLQAAIELKVDAIGFVLFPPSPRAVTQQQMENLQKQVPAFISRVGLLVNPSPESVKKLIHGHCLDLIQFHGQETGEFCEQFGFPYLKALPAQPRMQEPEFWDQEQRRYPSARAFLIDTPDPKLHGGTGKTFDWSWWPKKINATVSARKSKSFDDFAEPQKPSPKPLILAGGLTADNVAQAIAQTQPYAVDVSGGVERIKGEKCVKAMRTFVEAVRAADARLSLAAND